MFQGMKGVVCCSKVMIMRSHAVLVEQLSTAAKDAGVNTLRSTKQHANAPS